MAEPIDDDGIPRYVGVGGMGALADALAAAVEDVRADVWVSPNGGIRQAGDGTWLVREGKNVESVRLCQASAAGMRGAFAVPACAHTPRSAAVASATTPSSSHTMASAPSASPRASPLERSIPSCAPNSRRGRIARLRAAVA